METIDFLRSNKIAFCDTKLKSNDVSSSLLFLVAADHYGHHNITAFNYDQQQPHAATS